MVSQLINNVHISEHFKLKEFQCRHCQLVKVDPKLVFLLEELRQRVGKPLIINSGYRCEVHNRNVGGAKGSQHVKGTAADIRLPPGVTADELAELAEEVGFDGIGKYSSFVHVDVRGYPARWTG